VGSVLADPVSGEQSRVAAGPTRTAPLPGEVGAYLRAALRGVVVSGSARSAFAGAPADWPVAGKTGTGEVLGKRDTSWFVSYAPAKAPEWVVSVVISQAGTGASAAAPVARAVHEALRGLR
jgi:penicillin-binding protein 2